jgi:hypothetical protein
MAVCLTKWINCLGFCSFTNFTYKTFCFILCWESWEWTAVAYDNEINVFYNWSWIIPELCQKLCYWYRWSGTTLGRHLCQEDTSLICLKELMKPCLKIKLIVVGKEKKTFFYSQPEWAPHPANWYNRRDELNLVSFLRNIENISSYSFSNSCRQPLQAGYYILASYGSIPPKTQGKIKTHEIQITI